MTYLQLGNTLPKAGVWPAGRARHGIACRAGHSGFAAGALPTAERARCNTIVARAARGDDLFAIVIQEVSP